MRLSHLIRSSAKEQKVGINVEDLKMRRYAMVIDRSGSMSDPVKKDSSRSRWNYVEETAVAVARKIQELGGTLDLYTFNDSYKYNKAVTADQVAQVFKQQSPMGGTDFVPVMTHVFDTHFAQQKTPEAKPTIAFVITDGQPSDGQAGQRALAELIIKNTKKMEADGDFGVEFLQVGEDRAAQTFLQTLDDDLQSAGAKFDVVDTKTCDDLNDMSIEDVLMAAVND